MNDPARPVDQRKLDTLYRLEHDVDGWFSTADPHTGTPYLVPLSFLWHDNTLLISTPRNSPTGRNLQATGKVRVGIGPTRDLVLIEASLREIVARSDVRDDEADAYADKAGWDPRYSKGCVFFRLQLESVQAWREVNELAGRVLMRGGRWVVE